MSDHEQGDGVRWRAVAKDVAADAKRDRLTLISAGVAFYFLIALIPAIAALVSTYALVADPETVGEDIASLLEAAPEEVRDLVVEQAERVVASAGAAVGLGAVVSILVALWAASGGCQQLIEAINTAYGGGVERSFVAKRGLALAVTAGALVVLAVALGALALVPAVLSGLEPPGFVHWTVQILRWPLLVAAILLALAVLYRVAPDLPAVRWRWISPGAVVAAVVWIAASIGFSVYVTNFGSYNEVYGSLGAVIIVMMWLFLTALSIVLGAEVNAVVERHRGEPAGPDADAAASRA